MPEHLRKAVFWLSGGMDSCALSPRSRDSRTGWHSCTRVTGSVPSGASGRHSTRWPSFGVKKTRGCSWIIFELIGGSALTDATIAVPEGEPGTAVEATKSRPPACPFATHIFCPWR